MHTFFPCYFTYVIFQRFVRVPRVCMFSSHPNTSAGDPTDKLFLSGWKENLLSWHSGTCLQLPIYFSQCHAVYWHDFLNISSVWTLTLLCYSQDRELRPEEMDGMFHAK